MLNWLIDELAFVELVICLTDFCSAQKWWNLHFDELTFDELTFCSVGFDQFSLLNFFCLVDMEPEKEERKKERGQKRLRGREREGPRACICICWEKQQLRSKVSLGVSWCCCSLLLFFFTRCHPYFLNNSHAHHKLVLPQVTRFEKKHAFISAKFTMRVVWSHISVEELRQI